MNLREFTVIVPTKNEARNIGRFLAAVPAPVQVIVVDASTDDTCDIIKRQGRDGIQIVTNGGNIATARQLAAEMATTEWLLCSDADVLFAEDYFEALEKIRPSTRHGGLVGAKLSHGRYRCYYLWFSLWMRLVCFSGIPAASGSNMLVRRSALLEAGGFDCRLPCNEDSELMWRINRHGYRVDFKGELKVYEFDHRRLDQGMLRKTVHSLARCLLLYCGLKHEVLSNHDWGYWRKTFS